MKKHKAFTLIELLVVIAIIGLLASIVLVAVNSVREKAKRAKLDADISQILKAVENARFEQDKVLKDVTGSGCSACSCWSVDCDYQCSACKSRMDTTMRNLGFRNALVDPWGKYYSFDENEFESVSNPCRIDTFRYSINGANQSMQIPFYSAECR